MGRISLVGSVHDTVPSREAQGELRSAEVRSHQNCMILITDFLSFISLLD